MPETIRIETLTADDLPDLRALQPEHWNDIIPANQFYVESDFCYVVKAVLNGEIVGCGTAIVHANAVWIANIIVHAAHRNKGIGQKVTSHVLEYAGTLSPSILLIATRMGHPVYVKLGFKDDEEYVFFKKQKLNLPVSAAVVPYEERFRKEILQLDHETTGEKREHLLSSRLPESYVYLDKGIFKGFTIPSMGEGLTLAVTEKAGQALMVRNLQEEKRIALPVSNKPAIHFLLQHGFETDETLGGVKMYFGRYLPWKPLQTYGRIGGNMG